MNIEHLNQVHGETIKTSAAPIGPSIEAIAATELCIAIGNAHPTAAQVMNMASVMNVEMMNIGFDGALLNETPAQVQHLITLETINGPFSAAVGVHMAMPTEAQVEATVALLGQPGGLYSVFGF